MRLSKICSQIVLLIVIVFITVLIVNAGEIKQGDKVTITTPGTVARLCPYPNCGTDQHISRIPYGTVLEITGITDVKLPAYSVKWFEITYNGKRGWISIFNTDKQ